MIKPFPNYHIKTLRETGVIEFRVSVAFAGIAASPNYMNIPHRIVYVQRNKQPQHLFNCEISSLINILTVNNIIHPEFGDVKLLKEQQHMLLGLVIEAAENLAEHQGKSKLVISSPYSFAADVLVDYNFVVRQMAGKRGYKGVKELKRKEKDENADGNVA